MTDAPGTGAASVAAQLLEFLREPARVRPLYLHGQEPLPEGGVVLKFALGRFSQAWQRELAHLDRDEIVAAARAFVRQVCLHDRATHYQVLGLDEGARHEAIKESYRLLMALLHPDRQDNAAHEWPTGCAQRVNEAHAVLSDGTRRAEYDQGLHKAHVPPHFEPRPLVRDHGGARAGRRAFMRPFLVVTSVVAVLFMVQLWWVSDVPSHYTLLERASPMRAPAQWVRDTLPRFMQSRPAFLFEPIEMLASSSQPYRLASVEVARPARPALLSTPGPAENAIAVASANETPAAAEAPRAAQPPVMAASTPVPRESAPRVRLAQATLPAGAAMPSAATIPAGSQTPSTEEVEVMVARLVGYYESGDADGLMSLFDPDELGFWKGMRVRSAYTDFFRATRQRRLRLDRLTWKPGPQSASAQGDATLVADFVDSRARLERKVDIDLEVAVRNGQPRLTRLTLFPDTR